MSKPKNKNLSLNPILIFLSFLIPLIFYIKTLCPTLSTYADAGEFPTAAYLNGFAHPPGYPLFTLIVKGFTLLPFGDNPAEKANLASSVVAAAAVAIFFLLSHNLTKNAFPSFIASQLLAFSPIFWRNAIVSEVFGLLVLFISLTFMLFIKWIETKNKKYYYGFLLAGGFGIAHHQLLIFTLIPLFLYFVFTKKWKLIKFIDIPLGILTVLAGFTPYLYIYFYASHQLPVMNWENPSTLEGLFRLITRANYGTFTLTNETQNTDIVNQIIGIFRLFYQNYQLLGVTFITLGTTYLVYLKKWSLLLYCFAIISVAFFLSIFSGMPVWQAGQIQYLERFILLGHVFASILIAFGITMAIKVLCSPKILYIFSIIAIVISTCIFINKNYNSVNQKNNYFADDFADDFLSSLPKGSILILEGDANINTLLYHRFVLNKRKDAYLILGGLLSVQKDWYLHEISTLYPDLIIPEIGKENGEFLTDFITINSVNTQVYLYIPSLERDLGLSLPKVNKGILWEYITDNQEVDIDKLQIEIQSFLAGYKNLKIDPNKYQIDSSEYSLLNLYTQPYIYLARLNDDGIDQSEKYYKKAIEIFPDNYQARIELGDDYLMAGMEAKAVKMWREALLYIHEKDTKDDVLSRINELENN
jgi:tetratricopeptide (TPR) repeat protein